MSSALACSAAARTRVGSGRGQVEEFGSRLGDRAGRRGGSKADGLLGVGSERQEGLMNLDGRGAGVLLAAGPAAFAVAAHTMGVDEEDLAGVVAGGPAQQAQGALEPLGLCHGVRPQQLVDGQVGGDERQAIGQGQPRLGQGAFGADAGGAEGSLVDPLQRQAGLDAREQRSRSSPTTSPRSPDGGVRGRAATGPGRCR